MKHIPATDAKAHLAELLRAVERGESFSITRHGKAIALLVPAAIEEERARRAALARFRERRRGWARVAASPEEIVAWRHEGHRA
jgi:prevent-host-death family protein